MLWELIRNIVLKYFCEYQQLTMYVFRRYKKNIYFSHEKRALSGAIIPILFFFRILFVNCRHFGLVLNEHF